MVQKLQEFRCNQTRNKVCNKSTIVCNGKTSTHLLMHLCRQNDLPIIDFESSIKAFDKIFGNNVFLMNVIEILNVCSQTGSVRNEWKFPVAK